MLVHVLADTSEKLFGLCSLFGEQFTVAGERLDVEAKLPHDAAAVVVRADLRALENIVALKRRAARLAKAKKRIFLVEQISHVRISQAYALGATSVLRGKIDAAKILAALAGAGDESGPTSGSSKSDNAVDAAASAIASMFTSITLGERVDVAGPKEAGREITNRISEHGLAEWLTTVRRHHEGTFQHCLLVTGVAVDFGLSLGFRRSDLERLSTAAMFHDIGKARVPLAILDKPGRLDDEERTLVETHPAVGYDVLKGHVDISPEVLDAVRHHHEYLDGSGYPDGLCAENITDIVRMLTISDIFAALIEHRPYKPTMPRAAAYEILCGIRGKLERALVASFKDVALTR
jgi:putative nucleotidyltransferase with HDIG domain